MYRVIDTIPITPPVRARIPDIMQAASGEGLLVILDPLTTQHIAPPHDHMARIQRPDGTCLERPITSAERSHGVLGLFFEGVASTDIPRSSHVTWQ